MERFYVVAQRDERMTTYVVKDRMGVVPPTYRIYEQYAKEQAEHLNAAFPTGLVDECATSRR